mmetsp:Transcript_51154/g.144094  ORF Transcript_51154/g.144094 Transcript_51154/m.144094 type:complete len:228 (+) Transcript_51154:1032-1715(+)
MPDGAHEVLVLVAGLAEDTLGGLGATPQRREAAQRARAPAHRRQAVALPEVGDRVELLVRHRPRLDQPVGVCLAQPVPVVDVAHRPRRGVYRRLRGVYPHPAVLVTGVVEAPPRAAPGRTACPDLLGVPEGEEARRVVVAGAAERGGGLLHHREVLGLGQEEVDGAEVLRDNPELPLLGTGLRDAMVQPQILDGTHRNVQELPLQYPGQLVAEGASLALELQPVVCH